MGSACAFRLARAGKKVVVLEKSVPGAEASSAAAGILGAHGEAEGPGPMADLLARGLARYGAWATTLRRESGIDVEYRVCGLLRVANTPAEWRRLAASTRWMKRGRGLEVVQRAALRRLEPGLAPVTRALRFPADGRVDPRLLFRAVHEAAIRAGARFVSGTTVERVITRDDVATGVAVQGGVEYRAPCTIVAAGSWSTLVRGVPLPRNAVIPVRGQMIELEAAPGLVRHVIAGPRCYLVPRDDGRVLVGATTEFVGYERAVTAGAVRDLLGAALRLVPALSVASVRATWANFRPYTPDGLPLLGRTAVRGLLLATGHYRNGILLAPITAEIVTALALGKEPPLDLRPFEAGRNNASLRSF